MEDNMIRTLSLVSLTALIAALAATQPAMARSIKNRMSDSTLASYCASVGVDTHTRTTLTFADGSVVSGTVHCEAEDLIVGSDDINDQFDDSDGRLDDDSDDRNDDFDDSDGRDDNDRSDDDDSDDDSSDDDHSDDDHDDSHHSDDSDDSDDDSDDDHGGDRDRDSDDD
jgi:hypothetical protein